MKTGEGPHPLPLQARRQIDAHVLTGLAGGEQPLGPEDTDVMPSIRESNLRVFLILLAGALAASVVLNIVLLALRSGT